LKSVLQAEQLMRWHRCNSALLLIVWAAHVRCTLITTMNGETLLNLVCEVVGDNLPQISKIDAGGVLKYMGRSHTSTRHRPGKFDCEALWAETGRQFHRLISYGLTVQRATNWPPKTSSCIARIDPLAHGCQTVFLEQLHSEAIRVFTILFSWVVWHTCIHILMPVSHTHMREKHEHTRTHRWMDGWMDGGMDGWIDR
jgi:hypothetical protein